MNRLFGTNGVRGISNSDMSIELATNLARGIGTFFVEGEIAIGTDTRTSGDMLKNAVTAGLLSTGISVADLGVLPSPALQYAVKEAGYKGGVIITASHNPPEFNGIKVVDSAGMELAREDESVIESHYFKNSFQIASWQKIGSTYSEDSWAGRYVKGILKKLNVEAIKESKLSVVLDCANGASYQTSPALLRSLGCRLEVLNQSPDGTFPGHPSEPTPENLRELSQMVVDNDADMGIAHDGDADRTIFFDEKGNYILGDKSLSLIARHILGKRKGLVVTPVSSSRCVEDVVRESGGEILYCKVGAPIVARIMLEKKAIFGGEENGGMIFPEHQYCRDGGMAAGKMLEILAETGRSLSELVADLPAYYTTKMKVSCSDEIKEAAIRRMEEIIGSWTVDRTDGLKMLRDDEWVLIRPSGTEPIIRIYAEARTEGRARVLAHENSKTLSEIVRELQDKK